MSLRKKIRPTLLASSAASLGLILSLAFPVEAAPLKVCRKLDGSVVVKKNCRGSDTRLDITSLTGADGQLRIYGDGSAGALTIADGDTQFLRSIVTDGNYQFTNCTIGTGATLTIDSGTVLRCSGTFENRGEIDIPTNSASYSTGYFPPSGPLPAFGPPTPSFAGSLAWGGEIGDGSEIRSGGQAASGVGTGEAAAITKPGTNGGGSGAGGLDAVGGRGGGTVVVLAEGAITNNSGAQIFASGAAGASNSGSGGGGGGIIILASKTSVTNSGTVTAQGGNGAACSATDGRGGGGGGGIVRFIAPVITQGTVSVVAGTGGAGCTGSIVGTPTFLTRAGGGGGGACGGSGGDGGSVTTTGDGSGGSGGTSGYALTTIADPTAIF